MNKRRLFVWMLPGLAFTAVVFAGNGSLPLSDAPETLPQLAPNRGIAWIVGRTHTIWVESSPAGAVFSAQTNSGTRLVRNATLGELQRSHPGLFREISPGLARTGLTESPLGSIDLGD